MQRPTRLGILAAAALAATAPRCTRRAAPQPPRDAPLARDVPSVRDASRSADVALADAGPPSPALTARVEGDALVVRRGARAARWGHARDGTLSWRVVPLTTDRRERAVFVALTPDPLDSLGQINVAGRAPRVVSSLALVRVRPDRDELETLWSRELREAPSLRGGPDGLRAVLADVDGDGRYEVLTRTRERASAEGLGSLGAIGSAGPRDAGVRYGAPEVARFDPASGRFGPAPSVQGDPARYFDEPDDVAVAQALGRAGYEGASLVRCADVDEADLALSRTSALGAAPRAHPVEVVGERACVFVGRAADAGAAAGGRFLAVVRVAQGAALSVAAVERVDAPPRRARAPGLASCRNRVSGADQVFAADWNAEGTERALVATFERGPSVVARVLRWDGARLAAAPDEPVVTAGCTAGAGRVVVEPDPRGGPTRVRVAAPEP